MASMILVNKEEGDKIVKGWKIETLRPVNPQNKGYFKKGGIYWVHVGRDFKAPHLCRVLIYERNFINIDDLTDDDVYDLGYESKGEYLAQPYNQRNPSPERVKYTFITLEDLLEMVNNCMGTIIELMEVFKYIEDSKLCEGVPKDLYYYYDSLERIEQAFEQIADNIGGLL